MTDMTRTLLNLIAAGQAEDAARRALEREDARDMRGLILAQRALEDAEQTTRAAEAAFRATVLQGAIEVLAEVAGWPHKDGEHPLADKARAVLAAAGNAGHILANREDSAAGGER